MDEQVTLVSQDGQDFKIEMKIANKMETVRNLLEDSGSDTPIPMPNIDGKILTKIVEYAQYHTEHSIATEDTRNWDKDFSCMDLITLFELMAAANFMEMKDLLTLCTQTAASHIKGKNPDQIRELFGETEPFTQEELDEASKETLWSEER